MKKFLSLLLASMLTLSLLAGCGGSSGGSTSGGNASAASGSTGAAAAGGAGSAAAGDKVLHMRLLKPLQATDWAATTNTIDMQITWVQVFEGLYGMDEVNGGYYNLLAKDIQVSDDGLVYTITLQDATFQNGDPLTADDVVFSYNKAKEISRFNYVTSFINKVEAKDEKTVVMTLDYPYSAIAHTFWSIKIYSQREYEEVVASGKEFGTEAHTAGTGPYYIANYDLASGVTLKAYDNYWGGAPEIKTVEYRVIAEDSAAVIAFENGELDYFNDVPLSDWKNVEAAAGENCSLVKGNNIRFLAINYLSPTNNNILGNEKVREAIFYAINKDDLVASPTSGYGQVAYEYMPSEYVSTSPSVKDGKFTTYDFNLDKAHQCLLDAGFTEDEIKAGIDVGTILTYGEATADKGKATVVIQANLAAAGMKANVEVAEAANVTPRMYAQEYDLAIFADSGNYDYNNIRQQVHSESVGMYLVRFKDEKSPFDWQRLEELVDAGVATSDEKERYDIYTELWSIVMDTKTILPLYHMPVGIAWSKNITVDNVNPTYYHITDFHWAQ